MLDNKMLVKNKLNLLVLIFVANLLTLINFLLDWPLVRLANQQATNFIDLDLVLRSLDCALHADPNNSLSLLYSRCNYIYGSPLLILGKSINFGFFDLNFLAWIFIIMANTLLAIVIFFTAKNQNHALIFVISIISSPPISLLFERANIDALIFILVIFSALLHSKNLKLLSLIILILTTLIKFYTLPLLLLILFLYLSKKNYIFLIPVAVIITMNVIFDLVRIKKVPTSGLAQFGSAVFSWYFDQLGLHFHKGIWVIFGFFATLGTAYFLLKNPERFAPELSTKFQIRNTSSIDMILIWTSLIFVTCYLFGFNYDYRLIFLASGGMLILKFIGNGGSKTWKFLFILTFWGSTGIGVTIKEFVGWQQNIFVIFQLFGDLATMLWASYLLAFFFHFLRLYLEINLFEVFLSKSMRLIRRR